MKAGAHTERQEGSAFTSRGSSLNAMWEETAADSPSTPPSWGTDVWKGGIVGNWNLLVPTSSQPCVLQADANSFILIKFWVLHINQTSRNDFKAALWGFVPSTAARPRLQRLRESDPPCLSSPPAAHMLQHGDWMPQEATCGGHLAEDNRSVLGRGGGLRRALPAVGAGGTGCGIRGEA